MIMRVFWVALLVVIPLAAARAEVVKKVELRNSRVGYTPRSFYVSGVVADNEHSDRVGIVKAKGSNEYLELANPAASISKFIMNNVSQDRHQQSITLHIEKLDFDFRRTGNAWHLNATVNLAFYAGDRKLVEFTSGGRGDSNTDPSDYAEQFIRQTLEADMKKFEPWWAQNRDRIPLEKTVKVNFVIAASSADQDCIVYSSQRPLRLSDFRGPPRAVDQSELAATYSGNKYAYSVNTQKGQMVVNYTITPYFNMAKSWFKHSEANDKVLAHEQLHFDITALKTCEFMAKMRNVTFTQDSYRELLDKIPEELSAETNELQERYDDESNHGIIRSIQVQWEAKVKDLLKQAACY
jgi:hypothetical protein